MEGLSLVLDGEFFAVDVALVEKIIRNIAFTPVLAASKGVAGITNLKGRIVTLLSLSELLGRGRSVKAAHAVIFKPFAGDDDQLGLLTDHSDDLIFIGDEAVVPVNTSENNDEAFFISGIAEVENRLYRIIDVSLIARRFGDF